MKILTTVAFITFVVMTAISGAVGVKKELRFARGKVSATVRGSVVRGDRDLYYVGGKAGQTMEVRISALEHNAVFQVYKPGATSAQIDGATEITGKAVPKAGETEDATAWKGRLTASGKYLIVVGGTRGNATYKLRVTIRQTAVHQMIKPRCFPDTLLPKMTFDRGAVIGTWRRFRDKASMWLPITTAQYSTRDRQERKGKGVRRSRSQ